MRVKRTKIYQINATTRLHPESGATKRKLRKFFREIANQEELRRFKKKIKINFKAIYFRKDKNIFTLTFYFKEKDGGYIILNINQVENQAELYCKFNNGDILCTNRNSFTQNQFNTAETLFSLNAEKPKKVYHFLDPRPLDNLEEIIRNLDDALLDDTKNCCFYLRPNYNVIHFDPSIIFKAAGIMHTLVGADFSKFQHEIKVQKKFPGWKNYIKYVHKAYQGLIGEHSNKDLSKIYITLEIEKRIWAEQIEGISQFLNRVRQELGHPLTVYINGMTSTINGKKETGYDKIFREETKIVDKICNNIALDTIIHRGSGKTIENKLIDCKDYGFYIGPFGTSALIPWLLEIPGITFHNEFMYEEIKKKKLPIIHNQIIINKKHIHDLENHEGVAPHYDKKKGHKNKIKPHCTGYSINADVFEKLAFDHFHNILSHTRQQGHPPTRWHDRWGKFIFD